MLRQSVIGTSLAVAAAVGLSACGGGGEDSAGSKTVRVTLANHGREALDRWQLQPYLDRLFQLDLAWPEIRLDGAEVAARRILELAS